MGAERYDDRESAHVVAADDSESMKGLGGKKALTIVIDSLSTSERQLHLKGQMKVMSTERYDDRCRTRQGGEDGFVPQG